MEDSEGSYRTLCSSETLRSGSKGFFHDFTELVSETCGEPWLGKVFRKLRTDEERLRTIFTDGKTRETVLGTLARTQLLFRDKDAKISRTRRLEGYQAAAAGQGEKAVLIFSQAILRAPRTGKCKDIDQGFTLTCALLGRAEILMALKEYSLALEDLKLAAEDELPNNLKEELARKREECDRFLRENERSLVQASGTAGWTKPIKPRLSGEERVDLPGASDLLEIRETAAAGKHAVAAKEILPGDVLVVERPLAGCLLPEHFGTHCQHCFQRFRAPIGCPDCSSVAFCGKGCRDAALASYHKYECKILALLIGSGMSVLSYLALRMVTQAGLKATLRIYDTIFHRVNESPVLESEGDERTLAGAVEGKLSKSARRRMRRRKLKDSRLAEGTEAGVIPEESHGGRSTLGENELRVDVRVYDLVMHEGIRSAGDFFERTLMAAFLAKCLQRVGFFRQPAPDDEVPSQEELAVGCVLLKNLQLLQFNAHEFFETRCSMEHRFRGNKPVYLGVAIYPTVARFNHDCYPAVTRYFVGRDIVIRATRCLNRGDVVAENYGPIFTKRRLKDRQRTLAGRYWFRCTCRACQEDWPSFQEMTNDAVRLRCPTGGCTKLHPRPRDTERLTKCSGCQKRISLAEAVLDLRSCEDLYQQGFQRMDEERTQEAIEILTEGMKIFHRIAIPPHKDTHLAEIALSGCFADSGNTWSPRVN